MTAQAPEAPPAPAATAPPRLVRFAVDSDEIDSLFPADFVRTYADLIRTSTELEQLRARFPDSTVELIDRGLGDPLNVATIFDVEARALTPGQAAERVRANQAQGVHDNLVYCDEASLPAVLEGLHGVMYLHWIAAWGKMVVPGFSSSQIQFANSTMLGVHADLSVIWDPAYRPALAPRMAAGAAAARDLAVNLQTTATALSVAGAAPVAEQLAAAGIAAAGEPLAALRNLLQRAQAHHGALATLEHDIAMVPELLDSHASLLADLAHLIP